MTRQRIWNFHSARLSLAQSCVRELIDRSAVQNVPPSASLTRAESDVREWPGETAQPVSHSGLATGHPVMQTLGTVLDQIDRGLPVDAGLARAAFRLERASNLQAATTTAGLSGDCLSLLAQYLVAWVLHDVARLKEIESEFTDSKCDPGWLTAVAAWVAYYWDGKPPQYNPPTPTTVPFPLPAPGSPDGLLRVGILADWGTGEPEAIAVLDQLMQQKPDLVIHLGDIYYAGTFDECHANFLDPIRAARQRHGRYVPVYSIPGNHDYYSAGRAFYAILPQLNLGIPHASIQEHSFFCLRNEHWQLECMDTGYFDHDLLKVGDDITHLQEIEAAWHQQQLSQAGTRQVVLMSHHQLFSAFTAIGRSGTSFQNPFLTKNLQDWRAARAPNIVCWLWGHEHLLEVYAVPGSSAVQLPVLGRCVGYGAFPVFNNTGAYAPKPASHVPLEPAANFPNGYVQTGDDGLVYANGYVVLTLGAGTGTLNIYQVNYSGVIADATSQLLWSEPLPASPAAG